VSVATTTTTPDVATPRQERRSRWIRRAALLGLVVLVALGLSGALGVRARTVAATGSEGTEVRLTYPQVARPALAVPYELRIIRREGFDERIEVRITHTYLDSFDENGVNPEPAEATTDAGDVVWTFDPPPGEDLTLTLDTRVEPGVQWRRHGRTLVTIGSERIALDHTMWVLP
jgi:hypothetical protein